MTEPSQYFKGRTVQEQMDEVIGYVDKRAEEVAAAKADAVLQPAEQAKTAAQAAAQEAEAAKNTTLAALPEIRQDISGLKAEDTALDGRLDSVELKVQTAEGNIVTIQGQIVALQTADGQNVKINNINQYAVGLTGNQNISGNKTWLNDMLIKKTNPGYLTVDDRELSTVTDSQTTGNRVVSILDNGTPKNLMVDQIRVNGFGVTGGVERLMWTYCKINDVWKSVILRVQMNPDTGKAQLRFGNTVIAEVDM